MSRTVRQIFDEMVAEKATLSSLSALQPNIDSSQTLLTDLTSTSRVARWRLLLWVMAFGIWSLENITEGMLAQKIPPTLLYRKQRVLEFQYGDALVEDNGKWVYNPVVAANRIVTFASVKQDQSTGRVTIKVCKDDGAGNPTPLSTPEFNAFKAFNLVDGTEGTKYSYISSNPDTFKVGYDIYFDPAVMDGTGLLIADGVTYPVHDAIANYLKNLPFDGLFVAEQLDAIVGAVAGVHYVQRTLCMAKVGSNPYTNINTANPSIYPPFAGFGRISTATGETLADTLNFIPNPQQVL